MKHTSCILPIVMVLILATLVGCSGAGAGSQSATPATALDTSYPDALPVQQQLALGTLQIEGTDMS